MDGHLYNQEEVEKEKNFGKKSGKKWQNIIVKAVSLQKKETESGKKEKKKRGDVMKTLKVVDQKHVEREKCVEKAAKAEANAQRADVERVAKAVDAVK